jgi:prepilin-type N-terminal cleavage/methylation domain-containing protein
MGCWTEGIEMKPRFASRCGFTLLEIMIVVAIIGLLAVMAIPTFMRSRNVAQSRACANNLKQIESAKQVWGMEKGKTATDTPADSDLIGPTLFLRQKPICPGGGDYFYNNMGTAPTCTIDGHSLLN